MTNPGTSLGSFRRSLQAIMPHPHVRPFVCVGSPLQCRAFVVGFYPATQIDAPFWHYWSDQSGFDKQQFMRDYLQKRGLTSPRGVRARIERIVHQNGFPGSRDLGAADRSLD